MQPEPLDTPQEEQLSAPAPVATLDPSITAVDIVQPDPAPAVEKKRPRMDLAVVALIVGGILLIAGIAVAGYWVYQLSTDLTTAQQNLSTLQAEHDQLKSEYAALTSENQTLNADLTKAQSDLTATQADLKKAQDENAKLNSKLKKALGLAEILDGFFHLEGFSSLADLDAKINATKDPQLTGLWDEFASSPGEDSFGEFLVYLVPAITDALR